jgi:ribose transport system substrate-binding protein
MRYRRSIDPRRIWCTVALNLAICGAAATSAHADDLLYFEKQIAPFTKKPEFVAPGPAFDAQTCMKGKTILSIPVSSADPFTGNTEKDVAAAAKKVGFMFTTWENQGQSSQWVQGMDTGESEDQSCRPCRRNRPTRPCAVS